MFEQVKEWCTLSPISQKTWCYSVAIQSHYMIINLDLSSFSVYSYVMTWQPLALLILYY